ncbi:MAG: hypothetical protein AAGF95_28980 [Chloroflexota bacterium]
MPNWNDVRWDWGAADDAANTLRRIANELSELRGQRGDKAVFVLSGSAGPYQSVFFEDFDTIQNTSAGLSNDCHALANRISRLSEEAREEQQQRERERERWKRRQREKERERAEDSSP